MDKFVGIKLVVFIGSSILNLISACTITAGTSKILNGACDFSGGGTCGYTINGSWKVRRGQYSYGRIIIPDFNKAGDTDGYYAEFDLGGGSLNHEKTLVSPTLSPGSYCLSFRYYKTDSSSVLAVFVKTSKTQQLIWNATYGAVKSWSEYTVTVSTNEQFQIIFSSDKPPGWFNMNTVGLDNIILSKVLFPLKTSTAIFESPFTTSSEIYKNISTSRTDDLFAPSSFVTMPTIGSTVYTLQYYETITSSPISAEELGLSEFINPSPSWTRQSTVVPPETTFELLGTHMPVATTPTQLVVFLSTSELNPTTIDSVRQMRETPVIQSVSENAVLPSGPYEILESATSNHFELYSPRLEQTSLEILATPIITGVLLPNSEFPPMISFSPSLSDYDHLPFVKFISKGSIWNPRVSPTMTITSSKEKSKISPSASWTISKSADAMNSSVDVTYTGNSTTSGLQLLSNAIQIECGKNMWNISINMTRLRQLYPLAREDAIYLGTNECTGILLANMLLFQHPLQNCLSTKTKTNTSINFRNKLIYADHDPNYIFIIRGHIWELTVECDVPRVAAYHTHLHHGTLYHPDAVITPAPDQSALFLSFYKDSSFHDMISDRFLHVKLGDRVFVKAFIMTQDDDVKLVLQSCYVTSPTRRSMRYFLIKDGCVEDPNTHIISYSLHEIRFVYREIEFASNSEGLEIYCQAITCDITDFSSRCSPPCGTQHLIG